MAHYLAPLLTLQAMIISSHRPLDASILQSTKLIVFLGTPHRGSHVLDSSIAKAGLSFMKLANREIPKNVKSMLQPRGDESFMINTDFIRVKGQIEIVNFYEQVARAHLQDLVCCAHPNTHCLLLTTLLRLLTRIRPYSTRNAPKISRSQEIMSTWCVLRVPKTMPIIPSDKLFNARLQRLLRY